MEAVRLCVCVRGRLCGPSFLWHSHHILSLIHISYAHANEVVEQASIQAQAIVDSAVNDANGIRQSSIQYTDDMLRSLQTIINHTMEGAKGRFDAFMTSMQSSYDIVSSNRNELSGGIVRPEEGEGQASQEMDDGQQKA